MEISTASPHARAALFRFNSSETNPNISYNILHNLAPNPPIHLQLPLNRPEYKRPRPMKTKPPPKRSSRKPITFTSDVLYLMDSLKLRIPLDIYISLVKECTKLADPARAIELYEHIRRSGLRFDLPLLNRVLLMCVSSGCFEHARQLFDQMSLRDFNSWAVMVAGCVQNREHEEAVKLFIKMLGEKEFENIGDNLMEFSVSGLLVCVLKACLYTSDFELGMQVHGWLWKMGYSRNTALSSFLINFYGKLKFSQDAQSVFEQVRSQNTSVWTSRIVNCCGEDDVEEVIRVLKEMGKEGVRMNGYTFSTVLKTCGRIGDAGCGRQVHANVMKLGLETNDFVQCALVDLYGKCGFLNDAVKAFEIGRGRRNVASCNAMLRIYMQHGLCIEAMRILYEMKMSGFLPHESILNELMLVCGSRVAESKMDKCMQNTKFND